MLFTRLAFFACTDVHGTSDDVCVFNRKKRDRSVLWEDNERHLYEVVEVTGFEQWVPTCSESERHKSLTRILSQVTLCRARIIPLVREDNGLAPFLDEAWNRLTRLHRAPNGQTLPCRQGSQTELERA
jgi:hypothetical protein